MAYTILQDLRRVRADHKSTVVRFMTVIHRVGDGLSRSGARPFTESEKTILTKMVRIVGKMLDTDQKLVDTQARYDEALKITGKKSL
jgi:hypothetical protein